MVFKIRIWYKRPMFLFSDIAIFLALTVPSDRFWHWWTASFFKSSYSRSYKCFIIGRIITEQSDLATNWQRFVADILRQGIDKRNHYSFFSVRQAFFGMLCLPLWSNHRLGTNKQSQQYFGLSPTRWTLRLCHLVHHVCLAGTQRDIPYNIHDA